MEAGKRSPRRKSCVFPLNSKEETTFLLRIPNISCHLTFSLRGPPGSIHPFHILTFTSSDALRRALRLYESSGGGFVERCLCSHHPLRPELQLTHTNRGPGLAFCCVCLFWLERQDTFTMTRPVYRYTRVRRLPQPSVWGHLNKQNKKQHRWHPQKFGV